MKITADQVDAWSKREENHRWEAVIGPYYKRSDGTVDIEALHDIARLNGILDTRSRYESLNTGQIAMNIRNRLRPLWLKGKLELPVE
nr:hypothetical protein [Mesorhizobium sp.]